MYSYMYIHEYQITGTQGAEYERGGYRSMNHNTSTRAATNDYLHL